MKHFFTSVIGLMSLFVSSGLFAQEELRALPVSNAEIQPEETPMSSKPQLLLVPQYGFINGMKVEANFRLGHKNRISFAPSFFVNKNHSDYKVMVGAGLGLSYMVCAPGINKNEIVYFGPGFTYSYFYVESENIEPIASELPGIKNIGVSLTKYRIGKIGPEIVFGYQFRPLTRFILDIYVGGALRYSYERDGQDLPEGIASQILDFGYTGGLPLGGIKVGMEL